MAQWCLQTMSHAVNSEMLESGIMKASSTGASEPFFGRKVILMVAWDRDWSVRNSELAVVNRFWWLLLLNLRGKKTGFYGSWHSWEIHRNHIIKAAQFDRWFKLKYQLLISCGSLDSTAFTRIQHSLNNCMVLLCCAQEARCWVTGTVRICETLSWI